MNNLLPLAAVFIILLTLHIILKSKHPLLKPIINILSGNASLIITWLFSANFGIIVPLNIASIAISSLLGMPGVISMLTLNLILK